MNEVKILRLIILFPLIGFIINFLFSRFLSNKKVAILASLSVLLSFIFSIIAVYKFKTENLPLTDTLFWWINQDFLKVPIRLYLDSLSSVMILVVSGVSFLIHVYSISYMKEDKDFKRFFSYLNLFVFFMLILVLSDNLIITFFGWEGVGLASYLLIGFWYENISNSKAAKKAFIVNRIGDAFFIASIVMIYFIFSDINITELSYRNIIENSNILKNHEIFGINLISLIAAFLFIASCGKSAQFPLYVWLPDAMAGPTPVSALIHAATMVTAGVYLLSRLFPIYLLANHVLEMVLFIAAFTAFLSAIIALGQSDIKKILAYSTISQLGFMFMAIGSGNFPAGIFHLTTHAFFKALLFLCAGAIIHSLNGVQNIFNMGELKNKLREIFYLMLIGVLAISGFPFTSGFYSKELIIEGIYASSHRFIWLLSSLTAFTTSIYMTRMFTIVFLRKAKTNHHTHKIDSTMMVPLYILASLSLISGFFLPHFIKFLTGSHFHIEVPFIVKLVPIIASIAGIIFGYLIFINEGKYELGLISRIVYDKFYIDEIYESIIAKPTEKFARISFKYLDRLIIDKLIVEGLASITSSFSNITSKMENSKIDWYVSYLVIGLIVFILIIKGVW